MTGLKGTRGDDRQLLFARKSRNGIGARLPFAGLLLAAGFFLTPSAASAAAPAATTTAASGVHFNRATLNGAVNPGGQQLEECVFEYGESEAYGEKAKCQETPSEIGSGTSSVAVKAEVTGLSPNTEYHVRLSAKNSVGSSSGVDQTFATREGPVWKLTVTPNADYVLPGVHPGLYKIIAENVGDEPTSSTEAVTIENVAPVPATAEASRLFYSTFGYADLANFGMCPNTNSCIWPSGPIGGFLPKAVPPGQRLIMTTLISVPSNYEGPLEDTARISGGGIPPAEAKTENIAVSKPPFGKLGFQASVTDASRSTPYTQAGGHPYQFTTEFNFATYSASNQEEGIWQYGSRAPVGDPKEVTGELPPGLIVNPQGVPHCALASYFSEECERSTAVGSAGLEFGANEAAFNKFEPIFNLQPEGEFPGELGITIGGAPFIVVTSGIRDGSDYGISARNVAIQADVTRVKLVLWGVPADPEHDAVRGVTCQDSSYTEWAPKFMSPEQVEQACAEGIGAYNPGGPAEVEPTPFITMPTECSGEPLTVRGRYNTWQAPNDFATQTSKVEAVEGCNALNFEPSIEARPTTNLADAPSGFDFHIHLPQNEEPEGVSTPELKESVVRLPKGLTLNPSSAEGLVGCSEAQIGLHSEEDDRCPGASKLGSVELDTPLLHEPLKGWIYLATPRENPFRALFAAYISLSGQGVRVKLPGEFETDPQSGQITTRFLQNPQLPFEDLKLHVFPGARGALRTPAVCGNYETTSTLTPFSAPESGPPATPTSTFTTTTPEHGGSCPTAASQIPIKPLLRAGTETPQAGIYSPFSLKLVREDGTQEITSVETILPPGLVGRLAGIPYCSAAAISAAANRTGAAELVRPSCPAASEVGTIDIGAGAGPTPIYVKGRVYLAGPYMGAPLSIAIVTPAVAGPFDLGDVVVRAALYVNPETAQITAKTDEIPHILQGIPLDIRSVTMKLDRPRFTLNPTNCEESHFLGNVTSVFGSTAPLLSEEGSPLRFQVGGCEALAFKPQLTLFLRGATKHAGTPALTATLKMPAAGANIATTQVTLPHSELLDNAHIKSPCTRVQFAEGRTPGEKCPPGSDIGFVKAETPLLDRPLEGPVYLRANGGERKLPDIVAALNGQIDIALVGHVESVPGRLRTTFATVPDAPVSKFTLSLDGGAKGLLENSVPLCAGPQRATALLTGQNAASVQLNPLLKVRCSKHKRHRRKHKRGVAQRRARP